MRFLLAICLLSLSLSCSRQFLPIKDPQRSIRIMEEIDSYNQELVQLKASMEVRGRGVVGNLTSEQVDVVLKAPNYLYLSLRSFFGPPSLILTANEEHITMMDFSSRETEAYKVMKLDGNSSVKLFGMDLYPHQLLNLLLARVPLDKARDVEISIRDERILISAQLPDGFSFSSEFDRRLRRVIATSIANDSMSFTARYDNFQPSSGIYFPRSIVFWAKNLSQRLSLSILMQDIELNGEPVLPDIFYLTPH